MARKRNTRKKSGEFKTPYVKQEPIEVKGDSFIDTWLWDLDTLLDTLGMAAIITVTFILVVGSLGAG